MEENIYELDTSEMGIVPQFVYEKDGQYYQTTDMQMIIVNSDDESADNSIAVPVETQEDPVYQFINVTDAPPEQMYYQIADNDDDDEVQSENAYAFVTTDSGTFIVRQPLFALSNQEETEVAGRNLLTGQVISVGEHLDRLERKRTEESDPSINQKILLGMTPEGKKLYGKILRIEHGGKDEVEEDDADKLEAEVLRTVETTLTNLVYMDSMKKRLCNKVLMVKLFLQEGGYIGKVRGALICTLSTKEHEEWVFVMFRSGLTENVDEKYRLKFSNHIKVTLQLTKQSNTYGALRVNLSTMEKTNICIVCFNRFKTKRQLSQHYVSVHPDFYKTDVSPETFTCETCNRTFFNASSLKRHLVVHDDHLRTHECDICKQLCTDVTTLKKHLLSHVDYKPHTCELCERSFTHQGDLNKHRTTHYFPTSAQNYKCTICGQSVSRYSNLERHLKIHMNGNYSCHICGCTYQHSSSLTRHIVQSHVNTGVE